MQSRRERRSKKRRQEEDHSPHPLPDAPPARSESEIFEDLSRLCGSSGYLHALSYLIFRDAVVMGGDEFKKEDFEKLYDRERLIRTEVSTLVGLWLKGDKCIDLPDPNSMQHMIDQSDILLAELHEAMLIPARADFSKAMNNQMAGGSENPLAQASAMREAIFYSGESAFSSQYSDFARRRYSQDEGWLVDNVGLSIDAAAEIMEGLVRHFSEAVCSFFEKLKAKPLLEWTLLPLFCFAEADLIVITGASAEHIRSFLNRFTVPEGNKNERFTSPFSFNEASIRPFVRISDTMYAMLQEYVGTEALYTAPSYWMRDDADYAPSAAKHRGGLPKILRMNLWLDRSQKREYMTT